MREGPVPLRSALAFGAISATVLLSLLVLVHLSSSQTEAQTEPETATSTAIDTRLADAVAARTSQPPLLVRAATIVDRDQAPDLLPLRGQIDDLVQDHLGDVSLAVVDLQTGDLIHINGQALHVSGSVAKLWIGLAAWRLLLDGALNPVIVDRLLHGVFIEQSNFAAEILAQMAGFDAINQEAAAFGAHRTVLSHHPGYLTEQAPGFIANSNLSTALDSTDTLAALWYGDVFDLEGSHAFLERMDSTLVDYGISAGVPPGVRLRRKIGWIIPSDADLAWLNADAVNDIALVQFERPGGPLAYALAIYTQRNLDQQSSWRLVAEISRITWEFFAEQRYPPPVQAATTALPPS